MSEEPLSPDSAAPKKPRRVSTPRPRKTAKVAKEKPVATEAVAAPEAPAAKPATKQAAARVPRDPRLDDISGHEGPPARSSEPRESEKAPAPRQDRVRSNVRDARSEDARAEDSSNARPERSERGERTERPPSNRPREIREEGDSASRARWPEPETIQGGDNPPSSGKRKRRRKKKGSQSAQVSFAGPSQGQDGLVAESPQAAPQEAAASSTRSQPQAPSQGPRVVVDADAVAKKAWKIFLGEVGEEGLALIGDQDARDLTKRSFRLAEIFLEEQARRGR